MAITKQKGDVAEAYVTFLLKQNGFNVLVPWGEDNRYDIVSEKNGIFKRIQVKYITPKNGTLLINIRSCNNHKIIHYTAKNIDIIAAYNSINNKVYFIPIEETNNKSICKIRLVPTKNSQKRFVSMASNYESRFDVLIE